jgi:hypothetical protein
MKKRKAKPLKGGDAKLKGLMVFTYVSQLPSKFKACKENVWSFANLYFIFLKTGKLR